MKFILVSLIFAVIGVGFAFIPRLQGWRYFMVSLVVSVGGFLALFWSDLPFGAVLSTPQGPVAFSVGHLVPFIVLFYVPHSVGYFTTRFVQRRFFVRAPTI
jgi:hypothetical protein